MQQSVAPRVLTKLAKTSIDEEDEDDDDVTVIEDDNDFDAPDTDKFVVSVRFTHA